MTNRLHRECAEVLLGRYTETKNKSKILCTEVQSAKTKMDKDI